MVEPQDLSKTTTTVPAQDVDSDDSKDEWELIGSVKNDGGKYKCEGCFESVTQAQGGYFDVAYNHPRICNGGSYLDIVLRRAHEKADEDKQFRLRCSYFTGWNQGDQDGAVDIMFNQLELANQKYVLGEHKGRQVDVFDIAKGKFEYPESKMTLKLS